MAAHELCEQRHRAQARTLLEHRDDLLVEDPGKRVRPAPAAAFLAGGGKSRIGFDPIGRGGAKTRLRGGQLQAIFCRNSM